MYRHKAVCDPCVLFDLKGVSGRASNLANTLGISTCQDTLVFAHKHTPITLMFDSCVSLCHLSATDRFIVAEQQCLVLSLKKPVFSPVEFN